MRAKVKFGSLQLCKALENLGFSPNKQYGSSHQKWYPPLNKKVPKGLRPFIEVVHGKNQYFPPTISGYLRQLRNLGFTDDEIIEAFCK